MFQRFRLLGLAFAALFALAACNSTDATLGVTGTEVNRQTTVPGLQPSTSTEAAKASARLYVAPIIGSTVAAITPLSRRLAALAPANALAIVADADPSKSYVVKGYFSALPENGATTVVFVWDVFDPSGVRQYRIQGQENVSGTAADPWSIVPPAVMEKIADRTIAAFKTWQSGTRAVEAPVVTPAAVAPIVVPAIVAPSAVAPTNVAPVPEAATPLDEKGESVENGKVGELAIKKTWIGMAQGFWNEPERYLETYWKRFENTWVHGDFAMKDADGHWFILGRSDDTLKVAGKRVGPAEVESILVGHELVAEAAVIGVPDEIKGTAMIAFCVLGGQASLLADIETQARMLTLQAELKQLIAKEMGKPLQPNKIHFVSALPKTRNGKVMRRVIRAAYLGEDAGDLSALENPQTVEEIKNIGNN